MVRVTSPGNRCSRREIPNTLEMDGGDPVLSTGKGNLVPAEPIRGAQEIRGIEFWHLIWRNLSLLAVISDRISAGTYERLSPFMLFFFSLPLHELSRLLPNAAELFGVRVLALIVLAILLYLFSFPFNLCPESDFKIRQSKKLQKT